MTRAANIARTAYEQALAAAEAERQRKEAEEAERERQERERQEEAFQAALPILREWFPGVEWIWHEEGDYGGDVIVTDASEDWPPSFKLKVEHYMIDINEPEAGRRVEIKVGDYRADTSMPGYNYFSGSIVKSAADVGRYLEQKRPHGERHAEECRQRLERGERV